MRLSAILAPGSPSSEKKLTGAPASSERTVTSAAAVLDRPLHPYTTGLRSCVVELDSAPLVPLAGSVPGYRDMPVGCHFATRCIHAVPTCSEHAPPLVTRAGRQVACWLVDQLHPQLALEEVA